MAWYEDEDDLTVCVTHGCFVPCRRKDGRHRYSDHPYWVRSVRDYQSMTYEPANSSLREPVAESEAMPSAENDARATPNRTSLATAWSAYLDLLLRQVAEDGTPILELVLAHNPDLERRLREALGTRAFPPGGSDA